MNDRFLKRMENWRRVVRYGARRGTCAAWARLYVASRVHDQEAPPPPPVPADELDGWLVETVWSGLRCHREKMVLKYWHVTQLRELVVCVRLKIRERDFRRVLAGAEKNLAKGLDKFDDAVTIAANNLDAGRFPRILTLPVAGSGASEECEALIE